MNRRAHARAVLAALITLSVITACADLVGIDERLPGASSGHGGGGGGPGEATSSVVTATATATATTASSATASSDSSATTAGGGDGGGGAAPCDDTRSDPDHCGACRHDCLGGDCQEGACSEVRVSEGLEPGIYHRLVTDLDPEGQVYFTRWKLPGTVYQVTKAERATAEVVAVLDEHGWGHDLSIDHDWIYFTNFSHIDSLAVRGVYARRRSGGVPVQLVRGEPAMSGAGYLFVDGGEVWFTTSEGSSVVARSGLGGVPAETIATRSEPPPWDWFGADVVADAEWVYTAREDGRVHAYPRQGGDARVVEDTLGFVEIVGLDEGWLYLRDAAAVIHRKRADGEDAPESILGDATAAKLHDGWLYAVTDGATTVRRQRLDERGEGSEILATWQGVIGDVAVDAVSILWISRDSGELYRKAL